jgi:hypothetical protein
MQPVRREPDVAKLLFKANWDANWLVRAAAFTQASFHNGVPALTRQ